MYMINKIIPLNKVTRWVIVLRVDFKLLPEISLLLYHLQHAPFALSTTRSSAVQCSLKNYSPLTAQEINPVRTLEMNN